MFQDKQFSWELIFNYYKHCIPNTNGETSLNVNSSYPNVNFLQFDVNTNHLFFGEKYYFTITKNLQGWSTFQIIYFLLILTLLVYFQTINYFF